MIIKKKRIRSLKNFSFIEKGKEVYLGIKITKEIEGKVIRCGFSENLIEGEELIPKVIGAVTRRNAEGDFTLDREAPKETYYIEREWTREQWIGGGDTETVTDYIEIPRERYKRNYIKPWEIYLKICIIENEKYLVSNLLKYEEENEKNIINTTNILLEIFGECEVFDEKLERFYFSQIIKLNWTVLPKGNCPWEKISEYVEKKLKPRKTIKNIIIGRLKLLKESNPDFIAIGNGGFNGYIVYGYEERNIYILESTNMNNATYIFSSEWEKLSQLTKGEILFDNLHLDRIIHKKDWEKRIKKYL